ncbi:unnamed protein product [Acanthoscelides obtectus]|nr:unnamed protein product [Acanthoscelides obtectus]CAK1679855.1 EF-hand calcium-binding domain-containing protein 1 [Acanthoscelides obtectus]
MASTVAAMASGPNSPSKRMSSRGGAATLRGVALFLASARNKRRGKSAPAADANATSPGGKRQDNQQRRKKKMNGEEQSKCNPKVMENARRETGLERREIEILYKIYKKLITYKKGAAKGKVSENVTASAVIGKPTTVSEGIDRTVFREVLHSTFDIVTENMLMDRIFYVWDRNNCGLITLENWFKGISLFLRGNVLEQAEYCFKVYDLNNDGYITKDEMFQLLRNCLIKHPQEEDLDDSVKDLVDIVMRKMDKDKDGKVSLEDYQKNVEDEPLLLEAFGKCLPTDKSKVTFLTTLKAQ